MLHRTVRGYEPWAGDLEARGVGAIVATEAGQHHRATRSSASRSASTLFVGAGESSLRGHGRRREPPPRRPQRERRAREEAHQHPQHAGKDENTVLTPPRRSAIEWALEWIEDDELLEVTPKSLRLRKRAAAGEVCASGRRRSTMSRCDGASPQRDTAHGRDRAGAFSSDPIAARNERSCSALPILPADRWHLPSPTKICASLGVGVGATRAIPDWFHCASFEAQLAIPRHRVQEHWAGSMSFGGDCSQHFGGQCGGCAYFIHSPGPLRKTGEPARMRPRRWTGRIVFEHWGCLEFGENSLGTGWRRSARGF